MNREVKDLYRKFRKNGIGGSIVGQNAMECLDIAKIVAAFGALDGDRVRIIAEREQIVHSLEVYGCWCVMAQVKCPKSGEWQTVDSIGMCTGYNNPTSPMENFYVPDLMRSALAAIESYLDGI